MTNMLPRGDFGLGECSCFLVESYLAGWNLGLRAFLERHIDALHLARYGGLLTNHNLSYLTWPPTKLSEAINLTLKSLELDVSELTVPRV
jgi:hypothetical protein